MTRRPQIAEVDKNNDGKLNYEEFGDCMREEVEKGDIDFEKMYQGVGHVRDYEADVDKNITVSQDQTQEVQQEQKENENENVASNEQEEEEEQVVIVSSKNDDKELEPGSPGHRDSGNPLTYERNFLGGNDKDEEEDEEQDEQPGAT